MNEGLSKSAIEKALPKSFPGLIHVLEEITSTNEYAKALAASGVPHGSVVFANKQTCGRGRLGRSFSSPEGGIYFSMILRIAPSDAVYITTAAAIAVCRAVEKTSAIHPEIKWVNDIYVNNRKVCGILTEAIPDRTIILGIGINYTKAPVEIPEAGPLFTNETAPGRNIFAAKLLSELLSAITDAGTREFLDEYRAHSCVLGKNIRYFENSEWHEAKALDIDETGGLVVLCDTEEKILRSGEITLRM
ncbi:MAG TPA: biotin--[acetyl-CoA-carboxylase] ligase [Methanocorpusculum sp.]|nr:biotin--[acetyl-CoA-carboxylase] ligase [Methanocorpusculum sp.]